MRHYTDVKSQLRGADFPPLTRRFCVTCSCGYVSRWFDAKSDAHHDEDEHVRLMGYAEEDSAK